MKNYNKKKLRAALAFLAAFVLWTAVLCLVDVQPVGQQGTSVGLAGMNRYFHDLTGVHMSLYTATDWLSLIPAGFVGGFAVLGLVQWIQRKSLLRVDRSILCLGGFYGVVLAAYLFFEVVPINYRPILIEGRLEASYPSSTTVLVLCVMVTAMMQLRGRIQKRGFRQVTLVLLAAFSAFMVVGRLVSGVHWLSDIIGGALLSIGLVLLYASFAEPDN